MRHTGVSFRIGLVFLASAFFSETAAAARPEIARIQGGNTRTIWGVGFTEDVQVWGWNREVPSAVCFIDIIGSRAMAGSGLRMIGSPVFGNTVRFSEITGFRYRPGFHIQPTWVQGMDPNTRAGISIEGIHRHEGVPDRAPVKHWNVIEAVHVYDGPHGYHGSITAEEIARQYASGEEPEKPDPRLVLWMNFAEGDARDASGRGNHGRIEGARAVEGRVGQALAFAAPPRVPKPPAGNQRSAFHVQHDWSIDLPLSVGAMVLADETLFLAGPPDWIGDETAAASYGHPEVQARLAEQDASLRGDRGGLLRAISARNGSQVGQWELAAPPVWDGMAAAHGRLYLATVDGKILCLGQS